MSTHHAAVLPSKSNGAFTIEERPTPAPGPGELLIEVESVALNPIDHYQRDHGFPPIATYPTVLGSDISGKVIASGSDNPLFPISTRVAAFASGFYTNYLPDYGAFQKKVIAFMTSTVPLPDSVSFNEGSLLPMSFGTATAGLYTLGVERDTKYGPEDKKGLLIWGGASSIGSGAIQVAKEMGFRSYVTAGPKHHSYLETLGASKLFDYNDPSVVDEIVKSAKEDGVSIDLCFHAVRFQLELSVAILQQTKSAEKEKALMAAANGVPEELVKVDGVEIKFMLPPTDPEVRKRYAQYWFNVWLKEKLESGAVVPSPKVRVVGKGLEAIDGGLNTLREGVSGVKLVVEI